MRYSPSLLDEIRARLPVSQVVARRVKLKRQGRELIGLSPFKTEKTPSFTVNDQKGFYHCFASGEHGDIFRFVMKTEGLGFPEAVERLAGQAGVALPAATPEALRQDNERDRLRLAMEAAAAFFEHQLTSAKGTEARSYLDRRGVLVPERAAFRLGFAPQSRHALKEHLAGQGFTQAEMASAGLIIAGEDIAVSYDRFRNRLIFPIADLGGRIVAFGGRGLDADATPKYLNSPETPLFHKGDLLFNAERARRAAHEHGAIVIVEGYMDVIALAGASILHAVAPLGTALTDRQLQLLWRFASEPTLCFDGDSAGTRAASRAIDLALPHLAPGRSLAFAFLPPGQDPDDIVRAGGASAIGEILRRPTPLADVLWERETGSTPIDTPERRAALEHRLERLLAEIGHAKVREHYAGEFRGRLARLWSTLVTPRAHLRKAFTERRGRAPGRFDGSRFPQQREVSTSLKRSALVRSGPGMAQTREALLLVTLLNHPSVAEHTPEEIAEIRFRDAALSRLRDAILDYCASRNELDSVKLRTHLTDKGLSGAIKRIEAALSHQSDGFALPGALAEDVERGWRHVLALHRASSELKWELDTAERLFQTEESAEAFERLQSLRLQVLQAETEAETGSAGDGGST